MEDGVSHCLDASVFMDDGVSHCLDAFVLMGVILADGCFHVFLSVFLLDVLLLDVLLLATVVEVWVVTVGCVTIVLSVSIILAIFCRYDNKCT